MHGDLLSWIDGDYLAFHTRRSKAKIRICGPRQKKGKLQNVMIANPFNPSLPQRLKPRSSSLSGRDQRRTHHKGMGKRYRLTKFGLVEREDTHSSITLSQLSRQGPELSHFPDILNIPLIRADCYFTIGTEVKKSWNSGSLLPPGHFQRTLYE